jgi:hypothetical protein
MSPAICVGLPGERLDKHKLALSHEMQATLLPVLSFRKEMCQQAYTLFTTHVLEANVQNIACLPLGHHVWREKMDVGQGKSLVYMSQWGIEKTWEGEFPFVEMVIWRPQKGQYLESRQIRCRLNLPLQEVNETVWTMLADLFKTVERDELTDEINHLNGLQEEFNFYLNMRAKTLKRSGPADKQHAVSAATQKDLPFLAEELKDDPFATTQVILPSSSQVHFKLFEFVRKVKIDYRQALLSLFPLPKESGSKLLGLFHLAAQGTIYCNAKGFSLLRLSPVDPLNQVIDPLFQVHHDELREEFAQLIEQLASCQHVQNREDFCLMSCYNKSQKIYQWKVSVEFDPLPILERGQRVHLNQMTFILDCPPSPLVYSCKWKELISRADFESFLRWQFMMLKSVYYRFLLTQSSKYPDSNGSRENSKDSARASVISMSSVSHN